MEGLEIAVGFDDQSLRADLFVQTLDEVLDSLRATERPLLERSQQPTLWVVGKLHSSVPTLELSPQRPSKPAELAVGRVIERFGAWEHGHVDAVQPVLTPEELGSYGRLARHASRIGVRLTYREVTVELSSRSWVVLEALAERRLRDLTVVEGRLEHVNVHDHFQAGIYDAWTGQRVPCEFDESLWSEISRHLRQYVLAEGEATYYQGGISHFIIHSLRPVPEVPDASGNPDSWVGIGDGQYDDMSGVDYIRWLWERSDAD